MAKLPASSDAFAATYPNITRWVRQEEGWIEIGQDEFSFSLVRAVYGGGLAWEGKPTYPSMGAALRALDKGIAHWLEENRPSEIYESKRVLRQRRNRRGQA